MAKHGIPVVRQAPYSPDMAPCDFWLFPKLKRPLKGSCFDTYEDIMWNAMKELRSLPEAFQKCFQQWKERWAKFVESQGSYFEGD
jgi:transposase